MAERPPLCFIAGGGGGRGGGASSGHRTPSNKLFIKLSAETEQATLESIFSGATDIYLPKDRETGEQRG